MALKIISPKEVSPSVPQQEDTQQPLQVFIRKDGMLEFESKTAGILNLKKIKAVKFAYNDDNPTELYMILSDEIDEESFKIVDVRSTFYIMDAKNLFKKMAYTSVNNYENNCFELIKDESIKDTEAYKMQSIGPIKKI